MRIDEQRSDYHEGRPIIRDCGDLIGILCPYGHVVSHARKSDWSGSNWEAKLSDPNFTVRCCGAVPTDAAQLAAALPALTDRTPDEHTRAAARIVADMEAEGDISRRPKIGDVY